MTDRPEARMQMSLFEEVAPGTGDGALEVGHVDAPMGPGVAGEPARPPFSLVPHETFLAWPRGVQLRYCAARDRDSAARAETREWRDFYNSRADEYEQAAYDAPVPF